MLCSSFNEKITNNVRSTTKLKEKYDINIDVSTVK